MSNKVTKRKCCMSVKRHMFYGPFGTQNSMVAIIFKLGHRKCQCQVKVGQIRSNFQIQNFITKMPILSSFVSGFQECYLFLRTTFKMPKTTSQKVTASFLLFSPLQSKKDMTLEFGMCVVCLQFYNIHSVLYSLKIIFYRHLFLKNRNFEFRGSKSKNIKKQDIHFLERSILRLLAFLDCVLL